MTPARARVIEGSMRRQSIIAPGCSSGSSSTERSKPMSFFGVFWQFFRGVEFNVSLYQCFTPIALQGRDTGSFDTLCCIPRPLVWCIPKGVPEASFRRLFNKARGSFVAFFMNGRGFVRHVFLGLWVRLSRFSQAQWVRFAKKFHCPILISRSELSQVACVRNGFVFRPLACATHGPTVGFVRHAFASNRSPSS